MMKKIGYYIVTLLVISCSSSVNSNTQEQTKSIKDNDSEAVSEFMTKYSDTHEVFRFENEGVIQMVALKPINDTLMSFYIETFSKEKDISSSLRGTAKLKKGDVEIDEDENGIGYPVREYIYNEKCWIAIRLAMQTKDKVRINSSECDSLKSSLTPFSSISVLKKIN